MGLFSVSALRHLWRSDGREFVIAMVAMFGVLGQGLLRGVAIGALISLVLLIRRASLPPVAVLGRIPGTRRFSDRERHPENETIPGMLIVRPGASLLYFNMNYVRDTIEERVRAEKETKLVVLDLSEVSIVDMHAAEMLAGLADELAAKGIKIQAVEAHSQVRDRLRSEGLEEKFGGIERLRTVADVADDFLQGVSARKCPRPVTGVRHCRVAARQRQALTNLAIVPAVKGGNAAAVPGSDERSRRAAEPAARIAR